MVVVTAGIIDRNGQILIAQRPKGGKLEFKWEFPGGKIEKDETPEECLIRELHEEFGIKTQIKSLFTETRYDYSDISVELLVYIVEEIGGDYKLNTHEQIKWVTPSEMYLYDFAEADKPIVAKLIEVYSTDSLH